MLSKKKVNVSRDGCNDNSVIDMIPVMLFFRVRKRGNVKISAGKSNGYLMQRETE